MKQYDVIINGAGMVGAITALLMAEQTDEQTHSVAVIEASPQTRFDADGEHQMRVSAISKHNLDLFNRLGLGNFLNHKRMGFYNNMVVWDNHSTGEIDFNQGSEKILGAMTENNQIIAAAQKKLVEHPQIEVFFETTIEAFEQNERKVKLTLEDDSQLQANLLIGADGARSKIRSELGIQTRQKPYQQRGLVCYLDIENAPEKTALQAFNAGGPVGLLPMNGGLFSMVWSLPENEVQRWLDADDAKFINGLRIHINRNFGDIKLCSDRQAFPLLKTDANKFYQGRVVLVGDAAHTIHPLAGQGVNLGFGDAECLAAKMASVNLKKADDLANALKKYQRVRKAEVRKTSETMHALHHLFTNQSAPIKTLRAFGMNRLNQIKPIKSWLLKQAGS